MEMEAQIIQQYQGLVKSNVNLFHINNKHDREDLEQHGYIGLLNAYRYWKADRGTKFITYASKCIYTEILRVVVRKNKKNIKTITWSDMGNTPNCALEWLDILNEQQKDIVLMRYHGYTFKEIGLKYSHGISWAIRQIKKIQQIFSEHYEINR